jgi:hypothetical protein
MINTVNINKVEVIDEPDYEKEWKRMKRKEWIIWFKVLGL